MHAGEYVHLRFADFPWLMSAPLTDQKRLWCDVPEDHSCIAAQAKHALCSQLLSPTC